MSAAQLFNTLPTSERQAVQIIKTFLDLYNSGDGTGLFAGINRYQILCARAKIAAYKSKTLVDFWSNLLGQLKCPISNKNNDGDVFSVILLNDNSIGDLSLEQDTFNNAVDLKIIDCFINKSEMIVMIARNIHSEEKAENKSKKENKNA